MGEMGRASASLHPTAAVAASPSVKAKADELRRELVASLVKVVGKHPENASNHEWFQAVAYVLRGRMAEAWLKSKALQHHADVKTVYYLSMEFLIGRSLRNHLFNLGLDRACREALSSLDVDLDAVYETEHDAALGNGGLGRLAACFLDSLTSLGYPAYGYGIRYDGGMFRQEIENGWQVERPDTWLMGGNPWEFRRPGINHRIRFGGHLAIEGAEPHEPKVAWEDTNDIIALAHDLQVSGHGNNLINTIRLWTAKPIQDFDLSHFNEGNHVEAMRNRSESEALSRILYPNDATEAGRALRLKQEYFFVSASLQDILGRFLETHESFVNLPNKIAIQLNDTHPALAIPEMMRLLIDMHGLDWQTAWTATSGVFAYTNHTLLPEALETWPVGLVQHLLPRHLDIIYRINDRFLKSISEVGREDPEAVKRLSLIDESGDRRIRMANLAVVASHKVNGVSQLHTDIMRREIFSDFDALYPGRLVAKTNGIVSRRWLNQANPRLADLIVDCIGSDWLYDVDRIADFSEVGDTALFDTLHDIKTANKRDFAAWLRKNQGLSVDPSSMFDVQVKRIHEYKRQLLNIIHVIAAYNRLRHGQDDGAPPRTVVFSGKAAASYHMAKLIIKLINDVAATINADPVAAGRLKIVFVPNYSVTVAERIIPAADLSEQISTAGTEASGTGNMKLALNGALTIGTRDGANLEIGDAVGEENIFFFGLSAEEVSLRRRGAYWPAEHYEANEALREALDMIRDGAFSRDDPNRFKPIVNALLEHGDYFMVLADFEAYAACQKRVDALYRSPRAWHAKALQNIAGMARFSSDRTIREYAEEIWGVRPVCPMPNPSGAG